MNRTRKVVGVTLLATSLMSGCSHAAKETGHEQRPTSLPSTKETCVTHKMTLKLGEASVFFATENSSAAQDIYVAKNLGPSPNIEVAPGQIDHIESSDTLQVLHGIGTAKDGQAHAKFTDVHFLHDFAGTTIDEDDGGHATFKLSNTDSQNVGITVELCNINVNQTA